MLRRIDKERQMLGKIEKKEDELTWTLDEKGIPAEDCNWKNCNGKRERGRRKYQMLDLTKVGGSYIDTKRLDQGRETWRIAMTKPAEWQNSIR